MRGRPAQRTWQGTGVLQCQYQQQGSLIGEPETDKAPRRRKLGLLERSGSCMARPAGWLPTLHRDRFQPPQVHRQPASLAQGIRTDLLSPPLGSSCSTFQHLGLSRTAPVLSRLPLAEPPSVMHHTLPSSDRRHTSETRSHPWQPQ
jgi:hypothetical protein